MFSHCLQQTEEEDGSEDEFVVEKILKHKGKGAGLKFLVKWKVCSGSVHDSHYNTAHVLFWP